MTTKQRLALLSLSLGLGACSGSIFDSDEPMPPPLPMPTQPAPVPGDNKASQPSEALPSPMVFTLDPSPELVDGPFDILFTDQAYTPFDVQEAVGKPIVASLTLWKIQDYPQYQEVHADGVLNITFKNLIRDFGPETVFVVKRVGNADILEASLKDLEGKGTVLKIEARRQAADVEVQARAHAWNGFLKVTRDGRDLNLGRLTGPSK